MRGTMARPKRQRDFSDEALDTLLGDTKTAEEPLVLFRQIQHRLAELILAGELTAQLGYAPGEDKLADQPNIRNGSTPKNVPTDTPGPWRWGSRGIGRGVGAGDPGAPRAAVSGRGLAQRDQRRRRRGDGRRAGVAAAAARSHYGRSTRPQQRRPPRRR